MCIYICILLLCVVGIHLTHQAKSTKAAIKDSAKMHPQLQSKATANVPPPLLAPVLKRPASAMAGGRPAPATEHGTVFFGAGKINVIPHQAAYRVFKYLPVKDMPFTKADTLVKWGVHGGFGAAWEYALDVIQNAPPLAAAQIPPVGVAVSAKGKGKTMVKAPLLDVSAKGKGKAKGKAAKAATKPRR